VVSLEADNFIIFIIYMREKILMKAQYINPFLEAGRMVLSMVCGVEPKVGKIYLRTSPFSANDLIIIIGVTGKIKGQVHFLLSKEDAKGIASYMMGGMEVKELDEIAVSAIGEIGNMVMGNTSTIYAQKGLQIDITPPTILTGDSIEISSKTPAISVPMDLDRFGGMEIVIAAIEQ
jgi:chemotaxis protein CheX